MCVRVGAALVFIRVEEVHPLVSFFPATDDAHKEYYHVIYHTLEPNGNTNVLIK